MELAKEENQYSVPNLKMNFTQNLHIINLVKFQWLIQEKILMDPNCILSYRILILIFVQLVSSH